MPEARNGDTDTTSVMKEELRKELLMEIRHLGEEIKGLMRQQQQQGRGGNLELESNRYLANEEGMDIQTGGNGKSGNVLIKTGLSHCYVFVGTAGLRKSRSSLHVDNEAETLYESPSQGEENYIHC